MLYQRKRNFIYQKEIKSIQNYRIILSNCSRANESTKDEEIKNSNNSYKIKNSDYPKFEQKKEYENKKEAQLIEEKKIIKVHWEINKGIAYTNNNYNERRINSTKLNSDNNNIISLKITKKRNEISNNNNNYLRNNNISSNISEYNNYNNYPNSNKKDFSYKEEYKTNDYESIKSRKTYTKTNDINNYKSNYMRYKSDQNKRQMIKNCFNNYNYSNRITPTKDNISYENKIMKDTSIKFGSELSKNNYPNKSLLKKKTKINMVSVAEFPRKEIEKCKHKKYDSLTYNDIKMISKKFNKIYEVDQSDIIIKDTKIISPEESNYQNIVLSKINRLSSILLPNNKDNEQNINYSTFSKKIIEKKLNSNITTNTINNYVNKIKQIIFIQSYFRSNLIRKKILNKLYSNFLYITFYSKIKIFFIKKIFRKAFNKTKIYNYEYQAKIEEKYNKLILILKNIFKSKLTNNKKIFLNKFNYIYNKKENKINKGKNLIQIKVNQEKKLKLLYTGFITWAYNAKIKKFNNILENQNKSKEKNNKKIKRKNYNINTIIRYENNSLKTIKFLINKKINNHKDFLRKYFYQWYINTLNSKYKLSLDKSNKNIISIKIVLFVVLLKLLFIKHKKIIIRDLFQILNKKDMNKNFLNNIKSINEGYKMLEKYIFRYTYKHPLYCIMDKINNENIDINLMKIIMNKKKGLKELLKEIFLIWKNKVILLKKNDTIKKLFIQMINIYQKYYIKKILIKKLYNWKNISKMIKIKSLSLIKGKKLYKICDFIKNENIKKNSKYFFNKIKTIKRSLNSNDLKELKKIILYINNKIIINNIRKYFNKWIDYIIKYKILVLKGKIIYKYKNNYYKLLLVKYFDIWKNNILLKNENKENINFNFKNIVINNKEIIIPLKYIILKSIFIKLNKYYTYNGVNKYFKKWMFIKNNNKKEKIDNISKIQKLFLILPNEKTSKERIIKNRLLIWKNNICHLEKEKLLLRNIFEIYNKKSLLSINYYLNRWLFISDSLKMKENSKIIFKFCKIKIKYILAQKQWNNLSKKLYNKKNINYFIKKIIKEVIYQILYKKLIRIHYINKFKDKIKNIILLLNNQTNNLLIKKYLVVWKNKNNIKSLKQSKLKNMFDIVKYHSINNSIRIFNNIFFCQHINDIITRTELRIRKIIINQKEYFYKNLKAFF